MQWQRLCVSDQPAATRRPEAIKGDYDPGRLVIIAPIRGRLPSSPAHAQQGHLKEVSFVPVANI